MKKTTLASTDQGNPIELFEATHSSHSKSLFLLGGVHGDEPEGYGLVERFLESDLWSGIAMKANLYIIPRLNPDGCKAGQRLNGNGVDLNRNMPTKDWDPTAHKDRYQPGPEPGSEMESKLLMAFIERIKPHLIITAHSYDPMVNINGPCKGVAQVIAEATGYKITDDMGYPTPGSLGTWAGWERSIPTITLEIERKLDLESIWKLHAEPLRDALEYAAQHDDLS